MPVRREDGNFSYRLISFSAKKIEMEKTIKKSSLKVSENGLEKKTSSKRLEVLKTYKIYINYPKPIAHKGDGLFYFHNLW